MQKFEYVVDEPRTYPSIVLATDEDGNTLSAIAVHCEKGDIVEAYANPDPERFKAAGKSDEQKAFDALPKKDREALAALTDDEVEQLKALSG